MKKTLNSIEHCEMKLLFFLLQDQKIRKDHIQIEVDDNKRRTGYAFVKFDSNEDYEMAFRSNDCKAINS